MKLLRFLFLLAAAFITVPLLAQQNVGIGTTTPDASAILDINSNSKGVLIPRLTTIQRDAIANPQRGLQVLNLDDMCTDIFDGSGWVKNCGFKAIGGSGLADPTHPNPNTWVVRATFVDGRWGMVTFAFGKKGYFGLGMSDNIAQSTLWEYDQPSNAWSQKAAFPGTARYYAGSFTIGAKGYVVAGAPTSGPNFNDFWEYDIPNNTWTRKADVPGVGRQYPIAFSVNGKGYAGMGSGSLPIDDLYEYDPATNAWTGKSIPIGRRYGAVAFTVGNKAYVGLGQNLVTHNYLQDFWEYDPVANSWTPKTDFAGGLRYGAAGFVINNKVYVGSGVAPPNSYRSDFWCFDPVANTWTAKATIPLTTRIAASAFSIGKRGYLGTGSNFFGTDIPDFNEFQDEVETGTAYSSSPPMSPMDTYSDGRWVAAGPTLYSANSGNVGIGINAPTTKLDVAGTIKATGFVLPTGAANNAFLRSDASGNASWGSFSETDPQVSSVTTGYVPRWNGTALVDGTVFDAGGLVGIGTTTPHTYLQFPNGVAWRKLVLHEDANHDYMVYSLGIGAGTLRYQVPPGGAHSFLGGVNTSVNNEVMRIQANGNVGIGVGDAQARLHVAGGVITTPNQQRAYFHVNTGSNIVQDVSSSGNVVLRVDGWIWANNAGFVSTSDARIKNIIGVTDNNKDLATLSKINITDYKYKDEIANGAGLQKKVIAQQVKEIYPMAVNQNAGVIPNVFAIAKSAKVDKDKTIITTTKPHEFSNGDEIKLIFNKSGERTFTVTVIDASTFSIPVATDESIFVYGKKVNDLLTNDYDALTTLNISATQQLSKEISQLKNDKLQLQKEIGQIKADNQQMQKQLTELIKRIEVYAGK